MGHYGSHHARTQASAFLVNQGPSFHFPFAATLLPFSNPFTG